MTEIVKFPCSLEIKTVESERYAGSRNLEIQRAADWDLREAGLDQIIAADGNSYRLASNGAQPVPLPGWQIVIEAGNFQDGYQWTLYSLGSK